MDPYTSPYVWCIVDEGCNACTHSKRWMIDARVKWRKLGFDAYRVSSTPTTFNGVGTGNTTGRHKIPIGLKLEETGLTLPGGLDSHEMEEGNHVLLLSQAVQANLGFLKSVRNGTIVMEDYNKQHLEVARQVRTGLFMIRIDHLLIQDFVNLEKPKLKALMMKTGLLSDDQSEDDEDMNSPTALMNTYSEVEPKKRRFARGVLNPPRSEPGQLGDTLERLGENA